jgi:hypothetical protein
MEHTHSLALAELKAEVQAEWHKKITEHFQGLLSRRMKRDGWILEELRRLADELVAKAKEQETKGEK